MSTKTITFSPRQDDGFSLLEMLVILVIISAASTIMFSSFIPAWSKRSTVDVIYQTAQMVQQARLEAIIRRKTTVININIKNGTIYTNKNIINIPKYLTIKITSGKELSNDPFEARIFFHPDGSSTGGTILVSGGEHPPQALLIPWLTGIPSISGAHDDS